VLNNILLGETRLSVSFWTYPTEHVNILGSSLASKALTIKNETFQIQPAWPMETVSTSGMLHRRGSHLGSSKRAAWCSARTSGI
jgi:hypothetical protein